MNYKHCCVVDTENNYRTYVLVLLGRDPETGGPVEDVQIYTLQAGERLVDAAPPILREHVGAEGYIRPRWDADTSAWIEGATAAVIAAWEAEHPDPNARTLEQLRADKLAELSAACNAAITAGCDVVLSTGSGHISLTAEDQINLSTALAAVEQGAEGYPYHLDGQLCAIFPAADITAMAQVATIHKLYHTTRCNHLLAWARRAETAEEVESITYGAELPEDLAANMAAVLATAGGNTDDM